MNTQLSICQSLIKGCAKIEAVDDVPVGCALSTAVVDTNVYLLVKGHVDIQAEIDKLKSKLAKVQNLYDTLSAKTQVEGYKQVKEEVVALDKEKLANYQADIEAFNASIVQFEKLL